jgi:hypothetical protein
MRRFEVVNVCPIVGRPAFFGVPFQEAPNGSCTAGTGRPQQDYVVAGTVDFDTELDGSHTAWLANDVPYIRKFFSGGELKLVDRAQPAQLDRRQSISVGCQGRTSPDPSVWYSFFHYVVLADLRN